MKVVIDDMGTTAAFAADMNNNGKIARQAMVAAGTDIADETQAKCRANVAQAGRFGPRWTDELTSTATSTKDGVEVVTTFNAPWRIFETGGTVQGKPLLWIPLSFSDAGTIRPKDYPGELVRVDRAGGKAPLLISTTDGQPKYVGKRSVTIPKKFNVIEIATDVGQELGDRYLQNFGALHG